MSDNDENVLKVGDKVTWNWGSGTPGGKVAAIESEGATITTAGKQVHKNGSEENPAIVIERSGVSDTGCLDRRGRCSPLTLRSQNNVVKRASEINEVEV